MSTTIPGTTPPASAAQSAAGLLTGQPGGTMGKNEFIKLLVAQLQHQDPLNPMQGTDLAVQLAQFSSVEQLMDLNSTLQSQSGVQGAMINSLNANAAWGAIGRTVLAKADQVQVTGDKTQTVDADVDGAGGIATLELLDENGQVVGSREVGDLSAGRHSIALGSAIQGLEPGTYTARLKVVDETGADVGATLYTIANVDGVRYTADGPVLTAGNQQIPFAAILEVFADPAAAGV